MITRRRYPWLLIHCIINYPRKLGMAVLRNTFLQTAHAKLNIFKHFSIDAEQISLRLGSQCALHQFVQSEEAPRLNWPIGFKVHNVDLDPHFFYLRWTPEYRAEATILLPYTKADLSLQQGELDKAIAEFKSALDQLAAPDKYGLEFLLEYGIAEALIQKNKSDEAIVHINAALSSPVRRIEILPWVYLQLAKASKGKIKQG